MSLNLQKLKNVKRATDKFTAQCPACAEEGGDQKGDHLFIDPKGKFGCVVNQGEAGREHRQRIFALAGDDGPGTIVVRPVVRDPAPVVLAAGVMAKLKAAWAGNTDTPAPALEPRTTTVASAPPPPSAS
jgi:hypothetical protein